MAAIAPPAPPGTCPPHPSAQRSAPASAVAAPHPDLPLSDVEVELRCWGGLGPDGPHRAVEIWRALHAACNVGGLDIAGAHLLWAIEDGGPALLRDPDTGEAFVRASLRVATADTAP